MFALISFTTVLTICNALITAPGIDRHVSDGIKSMGYKVVYGDEDMTIINQVVDDVEKIDMLKKRNGLKEAIPVMPAEDVKCLMSVEKYCSKEMVRMKRVLIQALKEDCAKCTPDEKEQAGHIVASMLAHDPVAWKMFLTRYDGLDKVERILGHVAVYNRVTNCRFALQSSLPKEPFKVEELKLNTVGEPEDVKALYKFTKPGFKVRVKRYAAKKMPEI